MCLLLAAGIEFDLESFKQQLQRLAMPHQQFSVSQVSFWCVIWSFQFKVNFLFASCRFCGTRCHTMTPKDQAAAGDLISSLHIEYAPCVFGSSNLHHNPVHQQPPACQGTDGQRRHTNKTHQTQLPCMLKYPCPHPLLAAHHALRLAGAGGRCGSLAC